MEIDPEHWSPVLSLTFWVACFFLPCCATDKVAWDLTEYVNQGILGIAELERRPLTRYASARGENYTTEEHLYIVLKNDVVPEYERFLSLLRQIKPKTAEVRKLHFHYLQGAENICRGFKIKILGLEQNDDVLIRAANEMIEKGRKQNEKWRKELAILYDSHKVGFTKSLWVSQ